MRKNGAHLRTQSVIHNAIWPSLPPNRKYLSMCVFREEENISSSMYYNPVATSPVSPIILSCFPSYTDISLCTLAEVSPRHLHNKSVSITALCALYL